MKAREITVGYKPSRHEQKSGGEIYGDQDAVSYLREQWKDIGIQESFYLLCLNTANRIKGVRLLGIGGLSGVTVDPSMVIAIAMKTLSSAIIVAHNHPSGDLKPSPGDIKITRNIAILCEAAGIRLLDHIILSPYGESVSMNELNLIPEKGIIDRLLA